MSYIVTTLGSFTNKVHYYLMLIVKELLFLIVNLVVKLAMALSAGIEPAT